MSQQAHLLSFGPLILFKPPRGGTTRNLSSIIIKRVSAWSDTDLITHQHTNAAATTRQPPNKNNMAFAVTITLVAGNFKAAIRILCSEEKPAPLNEMTLKALQKKHLEPPADRRPFCDSTSILHFHPLQVSSDKVMKALQAFPPRSSSEPDGLIPQHLKNFLARAPDDNLLVSITQLFNFVLPRRFPIDINKMILTGQLIALQKKDGGVRPIAIGYLVTILATKYANCQAIQRRSESLEPDQLGVGIPSGAESAVHATRCLLSQMP